MRSDRLNDYGASFDFIWGKFEKQNGGTGNKPKTSFFSQNDPIAVKGMMIF